MPHSKYFDFQVHYPIAFAYISTLGQFQFKNVMKKFSSFRLTKTFQVILFVAFSHTYGFITARIIILTEVVEGPNTVTYTIVAYSIKTKLI